MPRYEHLKLLRLPEQLERRKHGGGSPPPPRDRAEHTRKLREELDAATEAQRRRRKPEFVDPSLILRVQMTGAPLEFDWERLGLTLLSSDADRSLVLFASDDQMREFRERLEAYRAGGPPGQKHAPYNNFIGTIERIGSSRRGIVSVSAFVRRDLRSPPISPRPDNSSSTSNFGISAGGNCVKLS